MKILWRITVALILVLSCTMPSFAHSGRTDARGGHKDNKNVSELGSYHYHHGEPAHLHSNGVCPYATTSQAASPAPQKESGSGTPTANPSEPAPALTQAEEEQAAKIESAIQQAQQDGKSTAVYTIENGGKLSLAFMKEIGRRGKSAGLGVTLYCDERGEGKLKGRLAVNPQLATQSIVTTLSSDSEQARQVKEKYRQTYSNETLVISLGQRDGFGMVVECTVQIDPAGFRGDTLAVYAYDPQTGSHKQIPSSDCTVDDNHYVHIKTSLAGDLVISDRPLVLK